MLHFSQAEFDRRMRATLAAMAAAGIDAMLLYRQESLFWLTGYDTFGYVHYQAGVLRADGGFTLMTRSADKLQAKYTSWAEDVRIWADGADADPTRDLKAILDETVPAGARIGVELEAYGLTGAKWDKTRAMLDAAGRSWADASFLITKLRLVKSAEELACVERAQVLADDALEAAIAAAKPGGNEAAVLAAMHAAIYAGGGDDPANEFILGSGRDALLCRYKTGRRVMDAQDQLTLEWAGVWRHYHSAMMATLCIGAATDAHRRMFDVALEALSACQSAAKPGNTFGDVFAAQAAVIDRHGLHHARQNACGYSLGTTYAPNWMDWPMFYRDNPQPMAPGQVLFMHMILFDDETGMAMTLGRTSVIEDTGCRPLSRLPMELVVVS